MAEPVRFELATPERLFLALEAEMVVVPGTEGDFGVLRGHAPFLSTVRPGAIALYEGGEISLRVFVSGGFAEVTPERCTVLADEAEAAEDLDPAAIESELGTLEGNLPLLREEIARASGAERERLLSELATLERKAEGLRGKRQALAELAR